MVQSEDTASSKSLRLDIRSRISELDARILALQESLDAARSERENLQSRLDDYKYPVLVEITSEIFVHFLPTYPLRPRLAGILSPTLLGQICRNWRKIALDTPRLWRAIEIYFFRGSSFDAKLSILTTWLLRSKNCPISPSK
ncbi:hypothetical protein C8J57DRAFT_1073281 [Mycena rebaudengoi]|nr:hypothetical protein C8J57DRAFT_1073281 [Mycena rebaudengoi]